MPRIAMLKRAGVTGVAVSVDSLDADDHDHFRRGRSALERTTGGARRGCATHRLDFVIQTTVTPRQPRRDLRSFVDWAAEQGAVCFNLYFLVPTGRGAASWICRPSGYETLLARAGRGASAATAGAMMVRAKCAPHFMRHVHQPSPIRRCSTTARAVRAASSTAASRRTAS